MAFTLPLEGGVMNDSLSGLSRDLDTPKKNLRTRPSPIALWRPEIVLPERPIAHRAIVTVGEPTLRPEATRAQLDGTRTLLAALAHKREALGARAAQAEARVRQAATDQERVSAMFETYRVESALDDVLTGTAKQLASLMKDRGLR
jgi:chorismate mutase